MPINGTLFKLEALEIAQKEKKLQFTASNRWLESFCSRHQINFSNLHGESAGEDPQVCDQWKEQLPRLSAGYKMEDIWNVDETGIFFRSVPTKSFIREGETPPPPWHGVVSSSLL